MTTTRDTRLRQTILNMVERLGRTVTVTTYASETYDPATGDASQGAATNHTVKASPPIAYEERYVDGELVREGDVKLYVPAQGLAFTPARGQKVTFDSTIWNVVRAAVIHVQEDAGLYELQLRR